MSTLLECVALFDPISESTFTRKQKTGLTLLIDANSLYLEAQLYFFSNKRNKKIGTLKQTIETFFQRLRGTPGRKCKIVDCRTEFVFSPITTFSLHRQETADENDWKLKAQLSDLNSIIKTVVDDPGMCAWATMQDLAIDYQKSNGCVFLSTEDSFTAMMSHVRRDTEDLSRRVICSRDPRFLFTLRGGGKAHEVTPYLFYSIMIANEEELKTSFKLLVPPPDNKFLDIQFDNLPVLYALLRATDLTADIPSENPIKLLAPNLLSRVIENGSIPSKDSIASWMEECENEGIHFNGLTFPPETRFAAHFMTEYLRIRGDLGIASIKVPKRSFVYEHPTLCTYRKLAKKSQELFKKIRLNALSDTKCFSSTTRIRQSFQGSIAAPAPPYSEREKPLNLLVVLDEEGNAQNWTVSEWEQLEEDPDLCNRGVNAALHLLDKSSIVRKDSETEHKIRSYAKLLENKENKDISDDEIEEIMKHDIWKEFQCALMHVFFVKEVCEAPELRNSFSLLGLYHM